jgi:hypothetical protein
MYRILNDKILLIPPEDSPGWIVSMVKKISVITLIVPEKMEIY